MCSQHELEEWVRLASKRGKGKKASQDAAKKARQDEFYTLWVDVEREMNAYLEFDPNMFRNKTVLLPCDDPEWSNFTKFFALHFVTLGLRKLISTSYAPESNSGGIFYEPTLFNDPQFDKELDPGRGKLFTLEPEDINGDGVVNIDDLQWRYLEGDGDFRSDELRALRDEADIVVTNPPFSLFREFMTWLVEGDTRFSILGNSQAITYKEVFPLIQGNRVWLGATRNGSGQMWFRIPATAPAKKGQKEENGVRYQTVGNTAWFTNIEHGRRHEFLQLMTMVDNRKFSRYREIRDRGYPVYDNVDAIEVSKVDAIPSDWTGLMGVPITFLGKYNPEQFEIVRFRHGDDGKDLRYGSTTPFFRILIRHKKGSH